MIETDNLERLRARAALDGAIVVGGNQKTMVGRVRFAAIVHRLECQHPLGAVGARRGPGASQQRAAALVRIISFSVLTDRGQQLGRNTNHSGTSSQNRSLRYFSPLSGKMVTIMAARPGGIERATSKHAATAAPDDIPTSMPSSRINRFTALYAVSV